MTAAARLDRLGQVMAGSTRSVRQRIAALSPINRAMLALLAIVEVVDGFRVLGPGWQSGDLLYHSALANAIVRGEFPPGGPYQGLPAYYPPLFHVMLAIPMAVLGWDAAAADRVLTLLWLPVLPIGTFLLARRLTGRPWVALLAAVITCFAGAYHLSAGRLWVNSLFLSGQQAYPLYPRDVVFALLPFGLLAFLRAFDEVRTARSIGWAAVAGILFGLAGLTQVQLLLPLPFALVVGAVVIGAADRARRTAAALVTVTTGVIATVVIAPWLLVTIGTIARNGGVVLDSSDMIEAARFGFWSYPREFGLLLPLAIVGGGLSMALARRTRPPATADSALARWSPLGVAGFGGLVVLVAWFAIAFVLGVLDQANWPLEDALRPQRLWLLSSQPMAILAAIGLAVLAERLVGLWRRPRLLVPIVASVVFVMAVPSTLATARLLASTWTRPSYADLDFQVDRVPDFGALLGRSGPRSTVLTYEDWSALTWFETGSWVVAMNPPGYAKLAFDPGRLTAHGQPERRADLATAFDGDPSDLAAVAQRYGATRIVLGVGADGRGLGVFDEPAVVAATRPGEGVEGAWHELDGNGWDAAVLERGSLLRLSLRSAAALTIDIRLATAQQPWADATGSLGLVALGAAGGERDLGTVAVPATKDPWLRLSAAIQLQPGERLAIRATGELAIQSVRGYAAATATLPPGWNVVSRSDEAVVLERAS